MLNPVVKQLLENQRRFATHLCVGLDPDMSKLPDGFPKTVDGVRKFLTLVIEAASGYCIAFKPNISFFEAMGLPGLHLLADLRSVCPADVPWIIDAKRGDIGNTSAMQARFLFDELGADATTVHPYMGEDSVAPFLDYASKLTFVLALTSNPGANTFEKLRLATDHLLWEQVVTESLRWNMLHHNVGLVVGATRDELSHVRTLAPSLPFLIPGVGSQGGSYHDAVAAAAYQDQVAIINISRSLLYADSSTGFQDTIRNYLVSKAYV